MPLSGHNNFKRGEPMIIQSDAMSMNARRSYKSVRAGVSRGGTQPAGAKAFSLTGRAGIFSSTYVQSQSGHLSRNQKAKDKNSGDSSEDQVKDNGSKNSLTDLMNRMQSSGSIRRTSLNNPSEAFQRIKTKSVNYLLSILFGRRIMDPELGLGEGQEDSGFSSFLQASGQTGSTLQNSANVSHFYYSEEETTCFDTTGIVKTADGRTIPFNISLEMSRSFKKPVVCDPLVINLNHNVADVSDQKFFFDLDADGEKESISRLKSGSGYLALDKNGDGVINDGSELFGTTNGNGFADLAQYDADGNGWIDEADEIFSKLRIWTQDENGNDRLMTLAEAGVGAICLGYEDTDFSLNSLKDNTTNALIRKTGLFLYEIGMSGTVQQMDLAT